MIRFLRLARALPLVMVAMAAILSAGQAQETQTEEMAKRAQLLKTLPQDAAKRHFGAVKAALPGEARTIGSYAKGCMAGAKALATDGPAWQVMRLSRNRNWGHPELIDLVENLAKTAPREAGWRGLLVGDISQPRGGPMLTGHASHQVGLDADIWLTQMPGRKLTTEERETMPATNVVAADWMDVDPAKWTQAHHAIIKLAAQQEGVTRIFVNPAIKKALCREATGDRSWLTRVRPIWGHNYHFHIRIGCPDGNAACIDQDAPPPGEGCGQELTDWLNLQYKAYFSPKPPASDKPPKPVRHMALSSMPEACQQIVLTR